MASSGWGAALSAGLALALWGVAGAVLLTADPRRGASIGAGALVLVALVLSIVAASGLAGSAGAPTERAVGRACTVGWGLWLVCAVTGALPRDLQLVLGLVPLALLVACFVLALRLSGRHGH